MWILKNSKELSDDLKSQGFSAKLDSSKTYYGFTTSYRTIPNDNITNYRKIPF
jgi:hypothetical protein